MGYLFFIVFGYLSGSVLYAYLLPKYIWHVDIIAVSDDHNPGTANAFKHAGLRAGIAVILLELSKACLPVYFAARFLDVGNPVFGFVMAAPVMGHAYPFCNQRAGGKAIAAAFGSLLGLYPHLEPVIILIFFYLLFSLVLVIRPHLFRSVITFALLNLSSFFLIKVKGYLVGILLISLLVIVRHLSKYDGEKLQVNFGKY